MARPFLADPEFVLKAEQERADEINTCIACNQACLDHVFQRKVASCLVNPRACHETDLVISKSTAPLKVAVIGAGPAGLSVAVTAAERGHQVVLFDQAKEIGGQFNMAKKIPGKEEFHETLRYYARRLMLLGVELKLGHEIKSLDKLKNEYDHIILATGVLPRPIAFPGSDRPEVLSYIDVLAHNAKVGNKVAIIGAGGIGFDVAEFLLHAPSADDPIENFAKEWGFDLSGRTRGGVTGIKRQPPPAKREVYLLQRKRGALGKGLGKTTGWIHRASLKHHKVEMLDGVSYDKIDDKGLHLTRAGKKTILKVDNIVICAGQIPKRALLKDDTKLGKAQVHLLGGALEAGELDAKRAIDAGTRLGARL